MTEILTIALPADADAAELDAIADELRTVEDVEDAGPDEARSIDPASIGLWIQIASGGLTVATSALALIRGVIGTLRKRDVRGATIELPNGTKISVDDATPEEIERLVKAVSPG